jgi:hypothetical protein
MTKSQNQNALKHGVFADAVILPGEDPEEFEELHNSLKREWNPDGPTEDDCILSLANHFWRKRRIARYLKRKIAIAVTWEKYVTKLEDGTIKMLAKVRDGIRSDALGSITEQELAAKLGSSWAKHCLTKVPRGNYQNDSDWLSALVEEINKCIEEIVSNQIDSQSTRDCLSDEAFLERELAIEERLDSMIDKTVKRLAQTKALKAMGIGSCRTSATNESSNGKALTKVEAPPIQAVENEEDNQES